MLHKMLDRLLAMHFREPSVENQLERLEQEVWCRINTKTANTAAPWQEKILLALGAPRFRMASLAIAFILGISLSPAIPLGNQAMTDQTMPDLRIFTVHAPYLTANLIERSE